MAYFFRWMERSPAWLLFFASTLGAQDPCELKELAVGNSAGFPGEKVNVEVSGGISCEVTGFSLAVGHDPTRLSFDHGGPGPFLVGHSGEDLFFQVFENRVQGYVAIVAVFDLSPPITVPSTPIPAGTLLGTLTYRVEPEAPPGTTPLLNRSETYGAIANIYSRNPGEDPVEPHLVDGSVKIEKPPPRFRRGEVDGDGQLNITDGVYTLAYLFLGGPPPPCVRSADVDASGVLEVTDPVYLLAFLFRGGPAPPSPFPACGPDPSPSGLSCESPSSCP